MVYIYSLVWEVNFRLISSSVTDSARRILAPPTGVESESVFNFSLVNSYL